MIQELNLKLSDRYGKIENSPHFRIVWSEDQFEKRITKYSDSGLELLHAEVRELPKYRQWIQNKYILESLTVTNEFIENDLVEKLSYEPIWVFEDKAGNPIQPIWGAVKFLVETLLENVRVGNDGVKYREIESPDEESKRIDNLVSDLFGNESVIGDALAYNEGIVVPQSYKSTNGDKS